MPVELYRIDERLIHGQVVVGWGRPLELRFIVLVDDEVAARIADTFEKRFGVALKVGGAHWELFPVPMLVLTDIATDQPKPITLRRVSAQLRPVAAKHEIRHARHVR